jgi:hypothetical protein
VEIYDSTFESNTAADDVSRSKSSLRSFLNFLCSNSWRGTCNFYRAELFMPSVVPMWRSMAAPSSNTADYVRYPDSSKLVLELS